MKAAEALATYVGVKPACDALRVARATFYRRRRPSTGHQQPRPTPARALSEKERDKVFNTLCSERFVDRSPAEVVATLLDEDVYLCSERTMYRVLASQVPVRERRAQRSHPEYQKPELMATGPGQVWSWDITRLLGPRKWSYFYLYVIMDIFSRYIVGWMVADRVSCADDQVPSVGEGVIPTESRMREIRTSGSTGRGWKRTYGSRTWHRRESKAEEIHTVPLRAPRHLLTLP